MIELFGQLKLGLRKQWRMVLKKTNREHGGTLILEDMVEIPKFCVLSGRMRCNISCHIQLCLEKDLFFSFMISFNPRR